MRNKNKAIRVGIAALLFVAMPGMAHAQQRGGGPGQNFDETMSELTEQLDLDDDQASQIRELLGAQNEASRKMIAEMRASGEGRAGMGAMRERMGEMRDATHEKMKGILSAEQMAKYEELVTKREEERSRRQRQGGPPGGQRGP